MLLIALQLLKLKLLVELFNLLFGELELVELVI
jgi:hypothetical protein